jgi:hypothetical protein
MAPFSAAAFDIWRREQTNIRGDRPTLANDPPPHALDQHTHFSFWRLLCMRLLAAAVAGAVNEISQWKQAS